MLHARIRTPHDAFHFIGEVTPYNLQTLRQHLRQSLREDGGLDLRVELDRADHVVFARWAQRWFPKLTAGGARVRVEVRPAERPPARALSGNDPDDPDDTDDAAVKPALLPGA